MTLRGRPLVFILPAAGHPVRSCGRTFRQTDDHHGQRSPGENPDDAPVKKSRAGICHDRASPNYRQRKYFEAFDSMRACLDSEGRRPQQARAGARG
jgi:hypothetical protein